MHISNMPITFVGEVDYTNILGVMGGRTGLLIIVRHDTIKDGLITCDFTPFQQYFSHIRKMGG